MSVLDPSTAAVLLLLTACIPRVTFLPQWFRRWRWSRARRSVEGRDPLHIASREEIRNARIRRRAALAGHVCLRCGSDDLISHRRRTGRPLSAWVSLLTIGVARWTSYSGVVGIECRRCGATRRRVA